MTVLAAPIKKDKDEPWAKKSTMPPSPPGQDDVAESSINQRRQHQGQDE